MTLIAAAQTSGVAEASLSIPPGFAGVIVGLVVGLITTTLTLRTLFGYGNKAWWVFVFYAAGATVVVVLLGISLSDSILRGGAAVSFAGLALGAVLGYAALVIVDVHETTKAEKSERDAQEKASKALLRASLAKARNLERRIDALTSALAESMARQALVEQRAQDAWEVFMDLPRHQRERLVRRGEQPPRP
jgi:hypothetical protein